MRMYSNVSECAAHPKLHHIDAHRIHLYKYIYIYMYINIYICMYIYAYNIHIKCILICQCVQHILYVTTLTLSLYKERGPVRALLQGTVDVQIYMHYI
jgi:hypothetical protein